MKTIAVIEDSAEINNLIRKILSTENFQSSQYFSGSEVMENLDQIVKNDLILLDIMLPEVSGFQIYEEIMDKYPGAKEKILFLTAKADLKTLEFFRSHDCKYITKPFDPYELINTIKKFF